MERSKGNTAGMKVLIVGLGRSGRAAAELLHGMGAGVELYDAKSSEGGIALAEELQVPVSFGERPERVTGMDMVVMSPGVPVEQSFVKLILSLLIHLFKEKLLKIN